MGTEPRKSRERQSKPQRVRVLGLRCLWVDKRNLASPLSGFRSLHALQVPRFPDSPARIRRTHPGGQERRRWDGRAKQPPSEGVSSSRPNFRRPRNMVRQLAQHRPAGQVMLVMLMMLVMMVETQEFVNKQSWPAVCGPPASQPASIGRFHAWSRITSKSSEDGGDKAGQQASRPRGVSATSGAATKCQMKLTCLPS